MKKIFTLIACIAASLMFGQSFSLYKMNPSWSSSSATITNGSSYTDFTTANVQNQAFLKFVNNSASTITLSIIRSIVFQNPMLTQNGSTVAPFTNFCFGNSCFPSSTFSTTSSDYTILGPSGSTVSPKDDSHSNGQDFIVYLQEGATIGEYLVKYKIYNVSNSADSLSFTWEYNRFLGINEQNSLIESVSHIYPNPATNVAGFNVVLKQASPVKIEVFNSLGALVQTNTEQKLIGTSQFLIDCSKFQSGLYFVTVTSGESRITRRLVVNK